MLKYFKYFFSLIIATLLWVDYIRNCNLRSQLWSMIRNKICARVYAFTSVTSGVNMKKIREHQQFHLRHSHHGFGRSRLTHRASLVSFHTPKLRSGRWLLQGKMSIIRKNKALQHVFGEECLISVIFHIKFVVTGNLRWSQPCWYYHHMITNMMLLLLSNWHFWHNMTINRKVMKEIITVWNLNKALKYSRHDGFPDSTVERCSIILHELFNFHVSECYLDPWLWNKFCIHFIFVLYNLYSVILCYSLTELTSKTVSI